MNHYFTKIPNRAIQNPAIGPSAFRIFCYLASYKNAFPSYEKIRAITGFSKSTISLAINELRSKNMLEWLPGGLGKGSNHYKILPEEQWRLDPLISPSVPKSEPGLVRNSYSNKTNNIKPRHSIERSGVEDLVRRSSRDFFKPKTEGNSND